MAKVNGPLLSLNASGTVGKTILYSNWNGRQTCALKNTPSNRRTVPQMRVRAYLAYALKLSKLLDRNGPVYEFMKTKVPAGLTWSSFMTKQLIGPRLVAADYVNTIMTNPIFAELIPLIDEVAENLEIPSIDIDGTPNTQLSGSFLVVGMNVFVADYLEMPAYPIDGIPTLEQIYAIVEAFTGREYTE